MKASLRGGREAAVPYQAASFVRLKLLSYAAQEFVFWLPTWCHPQGNFSKAGRCAGDTGMHLERHNTHFGDTGY